MGKDASGTVGTHIVQQAQISRLWNGQQSALSKAVTAAVHGAHHIVILSANHVMLSQDGDVMVAAVQHGPNQIRRRGV